ncbi:methionine--tRNA ligase [Candidatus Micrarchaeota archaeon]|nr:methionine--tRNA ligase [Candidatus Micrarchaeota archaeon]
MSKFFITTPIYYINSTPSVGSAYPTIIADVVARWHRLLGEDTFFLTGLDENSVKTVQAAKQGNFKDIKEYADVMAEKWKRAWTILNVSHDDFIRTTEGRHEKNVENFFNKVYKKGDIYRGEYEGLYCEGCEVFLTESELVNGECPLHKKPPKKIREENYFFKLSKYQDKILELIQAENYIEPTSRKNEVVNFIKEGLKDISISRPNIGWGITLPIDKKHKFWVWFDALINYLVDERYWPVDVHIIGKDITRFHCVIWVGMLLSAGYKIPKKIFAHGFFTINGQKMSKSLGNVVDPVYLAEKYSVDAVRYFIIREIPTGQDGDFSEEALKTRVNTELVANIGNFIHRVLILVKKLNGGKIPKPGNLDERDQSILDLIETKQEVVEDLMEQFKLKESLEEILGFSTELNRYLSEREPWKEKDANRINNCLYICSRAITALSILLYPFIPGTVEKLLLQIGIENKTITWGKIGQELLKPGFEVGEIKPLFEKIT